MSTAEPQRFLFIIGAMKAGTTSLFQYLADHPQIAPCRNKEPEYFTSGEFGAEAWQNYLDWWDFEPGHTVAMEASSGYTKMPGFDNAAKRIADHNLDARFVYVLRNPIDRIESQLTHGQGAGWATNLPEGSDALINEQVIAISRYATQLDEYRSRFPAEDVLLVDFDELSGRPADVVEQVCRLVDIDDSYSSPAVGKVFNSNSVRIDRAWQRKLRWSRTGRRVANAIPESAMGWMKRKLGTNIEEPVRLTEEQRERAIEALRTDVARLRDDYGFDVSNWGIAE